MLLGTKFYLVPLPFNYYTCGDPDGKYAAYLSNRDAKYPGSAYFLLAPGLSDSGLVQPKKSSRGGSSKASGSSNGAVRADAGGFVGMLVALGAMAFAMF